MRHALIGALLALSMIGMSLPAAARSHHRYHHHHYRYRHVYRQHHVAHYRYAPRYGYRHARHVFSRPYWERRRPVYNAYMQQDHGRYLPRPEYQAAPNRVHPHAMQDGHHVQPVNPLPAPRSVAHTSPSAANRPSATRPAGSGPVASAAAARVGRVPPWHYQQDTIKPVAGGSKHVLKPDTNSFVIIPGYSVAK